MITITLPANDSAPFTSLAEQKLPPSQWVRITPTGCCLQLLLNRMDLHHLDRLLLAEDLPFKGFMVDTPQASGINKFLPVSYHHSFSLFIFYRRDKQCFQSSCLAKISSFLRGVLFLETPRSGGLSNCCRCADMERDGISRAAFKLGGESVGYTRSSPNVGPNNDGAPLRDPNQPNADFLKSKHTTIKSQKPNYLPFVPTTEVFPYSAFRVDEQNY